MSTYLPFNNPALSIVISNKIVRITSPKTLNEPCETLTFLVLFIGSSPILTFPRNNLFHFFKIFMIFTGVWNYEYSWSMLFLALQNIQQTFPSHLDWESPRLSHFINPTSWAKTESHCLLPVSQHRGEKPPDQRIVRLRLRAGLRTTEREGTGRGLVSSVRDNSYKSSQLYRCLVARSYWETDLYHSNI